MAVPQIGGRDGSTANIGSRETVWNQPEFGVQSLKTMADQIVGVPLVGDPSRPFPNYFGEGSHYAHSAAQCFIGTNRTTLPTQIILQQILAGNWYTQIVAPLSPLPWSSSGVIQFDTLQFGPQLPQVVPEEGKTRIGKWEYDSKYFTVQRYGLGARFTHDFLLTPNGLARARGIMDQMQVSIEDHLKIGVLHALLHCRDSANARIAESQTQPSLSQQEMNMQHTIDFFGILQFRDDGVTRLLTEARKTMRSIQGDYDTAIVHYLQQVYCTNLNQKLTTYSEVGPVAYDNFTTIVGENRRFGDSNGPRTFLVEEFAHGKGKAPLDFLKRKIVVGHYALMFDHVPAGAGDNYDNWRAGHRDIQIMSGDNGGDDRATISFEAALRATGAWDEETGELIGPNHPSLATNGNQLPLNNAARRCSFWYRDQNTGQDTVVRHIGGQSEAYFSSWHRMADTVFKTLPAKNSAEVMNSLFTLISDVETMGNARYGAASNAFVTGAAAAADGVPADRVAGFASPLPPWMTSGAGLRQLRDFAQSRSDADLVRTGLSAERLKNLARAINVIQTHLIPHMVAGFGPNNAFLGNGSAEEAFDGFVNNCISGHLIPLNSPAPGAAPGGVALAAGNLERRDQQSAALTQVANRFQAAVTGFMGRAVDVSRAYLPPGGAAAVPPVRGVLANIAGDGAAPVDPEGVVFDPIQRPGEAAIMSTWVALKAALPAYAQQALAGVAPAEVGAAAPGRKIVELPVVAGRGGASIFSYTSAAAGGANTAYDRLVRILVNYGTGAANPASLAARAGVLSILTQVVPNDDNLNAVMQALGVDNVPSDRTVAAALNPADLRANAGILAALNERRFSTVAAPGRPPAPMTIDALVSGVTRIMGNVANEAAAVAAPVAGNLDPRNYTEGFYRASPSAVQGFAFNAAVIPSRIGGGAGPVANEAELNELKRTLAAAPAGTYGAPTMAGSRADRILAGRAYMPEVNFPLALTGMPGGLPDLDSRIAASEVYGTGARPSLFAPGAPAVDPGVGVLRGRYGGIAGAPAAPAAAIPAPIRAPGNLSPIYTPLLGQNWDNINRTVMNTAYAAVARVGCVNPTNWANTLSMHRAGFLTPWTIILARPFGVFHTKVMFLVKAGMETMRTVLGQVRIYSVCCV